MSSIIHKKAYQEFLNLLGEFQNQVCTANEPIFKDGWQNLQDFCQQKIFTLTDNNLDESVVQQWRSLQTEIQREFRLLNTDILFLGASRKAQTTEVRLQSIRDRITRLTQFSQMVQDLIT
ncbi:MAG: heterocyst frequency control protein PatD [Cyanobacteria bacterium P01_F01_bin.143]